MATRWYFSQERFDQFGPFSTLELRQLAATGRLLRTDRVLKEGMAQRVPAGRVKGLFGDSSPITTTVPGFDTKKTDVKIFNDRERG